MDSSNEPLISIVFTSYNHKEYLKQALDSLVNQTYSNVEIIIIDDCSTDGSQEILKSYIGHPKINLQLQSINSGSYVNASNYGATFAKGEYLLFAQCDDFAETIQLEKLIRPFSEYENLGVCFSKSKLIDKDGIVFSDDFFGREIAFKKAVVANPYINGEDMKNYLSFACVIPNLSAALIKRSLFEKVKGLSSQYLVVADWELWLSLAELTDFYYIKEPLNYFRQHDTTIRSNVKMKVQVDEIYAMFYRRVNDKKITADQKKNFRLGAGAIWFTYFLENKRIWLQNFKSSYQAIKKLEKWPTYYLLSGITKHLVEFGYRKIYKRRN